MAGLLERMGGGEEGEGRGEGNNGDENRQGKVKEGGGGKKVSY